MRRAASWGDSCGQYGHFTRLQKGQPLVGAPSERLGRDSPARFGQLVETILSDNMSTHHHHRRVVLGRLLLGHGARKDRVVPVLGRHGDLDRQLIRLAPPTFALAHDLAALLDPRERPAAADIAHDTQWHLPAHAEARTVLLREDVLEVEVQRG
jgi:hypothetical protein